MTPQGGTASRGPFSDLDIGTIASGWELTSAILHRAGQHLRTAPVQQPPAGEPGPPEEPGSGAGPRAVHAARPDPRD
ncbi:hypothetical protein [Streptomyces sp. NBC_00343]|uniref:hypothetical protein n=1 Tax=Streptomyces sp. NBC_00343 TaxID=2975719 RepID=UPI002E2CF791|nr:hypothetical protein [Streptomyces sp. NBC_00343]